MYNTTTTVVVPAMAPSALRFWRDRDAKSGLEELLLNYFNVCAILNLSTIFGQLF